MDGKENAMEKGIHESSSWVPVTPEPLRMRLRPRQVKSTEVVFPLSPSPSTRTCKRVLNLSNSGEIGKNDSQRAEEVDKDEHDLWEEEINSYAVRMESFLTRMLLVQGDRRCRALWKGSIVDSVVGSFLSQNVADQSSSAAFIELASKYQNTGELPACFSGTKIDWARRKKATLRKEKKKGNETNWDRLRKLHCSLGSQERNDHNLDSLNWEAVRVAFTEEVAAAIVGRGMHEKLAMRIQGFLNRLIRDHENIDLEWLRTVPPHKVKEFLMSIEGLGLKSVECICLLALRQLAFPVDTNVARVVIRLGWVPVLTKPSVPLHLLTKYPARTLIHEYLWPRLSNFDEQTLYELHHQMITFGKVFCTKKRPNCNACPMRGECKHFASARLDVLNSMKERDIEDFPYEAPDEFPFVEFNVKEFTKNLQNDMEENNMLLEEGDESKALGALTSLGASIPLPKVKIADRWRTKHQVFELPDSHPLLDGLDKRVLDDPSPYLLAIWIPGGESTRNSVQTSQSNSCKPGETCNNIKGCTCDNSQENNSGTIHGTLLIPVRTAMRGSFPLNGTHFQINEVFSDDESSRDPIKVSWELIRDLKRRTLYCGSSTSTVLKNFETREIQQCFWRGFMCFRGFNRKTRQPTPLANRFHSQPSKKEKRVTRKNRNGGN